jgi:hypothetical protein
MRWRMNTRVYLPLVLLFWLLGSAGSFLLGEELHHAPQGLNGVAAYVSQGLGSLLASTLGIEAQAAQSEIGPSISTTIPIPPKVTTTAPSTPHTAAPAAPPKANQGDAGNDQHKDIGHKNGGKGNKNNGDDDDGNSDNSDD